LKQMPLVLGFDTSHRKGSVAVATGEEILCEFLFDAADTHSATLMPAVDAALRAAKIDINDIETFAVTIGPGSFTGLRIGLATVKAFAAVRRRPVFAAKSLEVLAAAFPFSDRAVFPVIDAHKGEVYGALYDTRTGTPEESMPPFSARPEDIGGLVHGEGPLLICGTGMERYKELIMSAAPQGSIAAGKKWSIPSAALLALLALGREPVPYERLFTLEPCYIRPPDARLPSSSMLREGGDGRA
jgi:tRNA threonylcarbamoyladenosine biosynthesis protein TsaB